MALNHFAMDVSLAQEDRNHFSRQHTSSTGKRHALKKWFHSTIFRDDFEDEADNEESVVIEDGDDLIFIPTLSAIPNSLFSSSTKKVSPLIFEENPNRENYRRQKLKNFKMHLKLKMHLARCDVDENGIYSTADNCQLGNGLECYQLFKSEPEELDALFDYTMKSALEPKSYGEVVGADYSGPAEELQPLQNLSYDDIKTFKNTTSFDPNVFSTIDIWEGSEKSFQKYATVSETQEVSDSFNRMPDEDCPNLSMDSTEVDSLATSESAERSFERTPSIYLNNELTLKHGASRVNICSEDFSAENTFYQDSQDTRHTLCSSATLGVSSSDRSDGSNTVIYTIPTFKQKRGEMNVSGIVQSFRNGTLNEKSFKKMVEKSGKGVTFRSKEFYDEPPTSAQEAEDEQKHNEEESICSENQDTEYKDGAVTEGNGCGVTFDRYSCVLVYRAAKRYCHPTNHGFTSERMHTSQKTYSISKASEPSSSHLDKAAKPILKKTANEKEALEKARAKFCDKVDVKSFLAYFEHFEHQKHSEEANLGKFREKQLSHYYSKEFFPEMLEGKKSEMGHNSEYRKSKRATELNIGRKFDHSGLQFIGVIESPHNI
ncbi:GIP1 (YBR045C) [Zygosaccharomyces parabailii]|nr:GIP1 (YBR045C) [Zygosaccharomyces parabailii]